MTFQEFKQIVYAKIEPQNNLRILENHDEIDITNIKSGVFITWPTWSTGNINCINAINHLYSEAYKGKIIVIDVDRLPDTYKTTTLGQQLHGWGEIFLIDNGRITKSFCGKDSAAKFTAYFNAFENTKMTKFRYIKLHNKIEFYADVFISSSLSENPQPSIINKCSFATLKNENANLTEGEILLEWKMAALSGMKYAITRIKFYEVFDLELIDICGHPVNTNLHSMFAAGLLSVFKEFGIDIKESDLNSIYDFVGKSAGHANIRKQPDINDLKISDYFLTNAG
jgi:hypothetical protein